jgi:hypothetical protein
MKTKRVVKKISSNLFTGTPPAAILHETKPIIKTPTGVIEYISASPASSWRKPTLQAPVPSAPHVFGPFLRRLTQDGYHGCKKGNEDYSQARTQLCPGP